MHQQSNSEMNSDKATIHIPGIGSIPNTFIDDLNAIPKEFQTYGFIVASPNNKTIYGNAASFYQNIIPSVYIGQIVTEVCSHYFDDVNRTSIICPIGTAKEGLVWNETAINIGGHTFHDKFLIVGEKAENGFKALTFAELLDVVQSFGSIAGYTHVQIDILCPLSYC